MTDQSGAPTDSSSTSGIQYIKFAASGRNRFVTWIALLAALGGFLFGYDTGIIGQALPFVQKQFHAGTITASWIVRSVLVGAPARAASRRRGRYWSAAARAATCRLGPDEHAHARRRQGGTADGLT
jgi:Sugar (and other) transporter